MIHYFKRKSFLIFLFIINFSFAQRDNTFPQVSKKPNERINEEGHLKFTKTLYGLEFDDYVSKEIKVKIGNFMKSNHMNYRRIGEYELHLVKRKNKLYIKEKDFPEKLILLE